MKISIITVCYNSAKTIEETILSVLGQDYPDVEYIIIDGASTDGTQEVIARYAPIPTVVSEPDKGIYDAMNKGIRLAQGDVIGILNADDIYAQKDILSRVARQFSENEIQACYGDLVYFSSSAPDNVVRYWRAGRFSEGAFSKGWNPPHPTFFVKRDVYATWGAFDTRYVMGNDIELMMRLLEKAKIKVAYIPDILVKMRLGGVSNSAMKNIFLQNKAILQAARNLNIAMPLLPFVWGKLVNRFLQFMIKPRSSYRHVN